MVLSFKLLSDCWSGEQGTYNGMKSHAHTCAQSHPQGLLAYRGDGCYRSIHDGCMSFAGYLQIECLMENDSMCRYSNLTDLHSGECNKKHGTMVGHGIKCMMLSGGAVVTSIALRCCGFSRSTAGQSSWPTPGRGEPLSPPNSQYENRVDVVGAFSCFFLTHAATVLFLPIFQRFWMPIKLHISHT